MSNFSFNGITKSYIRIASDWSMPAWAPIYRSSLSVAGRPGSITTKKETGERAFPLPIIVLSSSFSEREEMLEDMASWLLQDKPCPLVFDKYPNRTLYAEIEGTMDVEEFWKRGQGTLNIVCSDPYKYGPTKTLPFSDGAVTIHNNGTVDVSPIIEVTVLDDITYLDIYNNDGYMRIGQPVEVGETIADKYERVLWDKMDSFVGWTTAGTFADGGIITGNFTALDGSWYLPFDTDYGTGSAWHGPARKRSIPNAPLTDFVVEYRFEFRESKGSRGRVELYLMDDQSQVLAKMSMKRMGGSIGNVVEVRLGDAITNQFIVNYSGSKGFEWNDFQGLIRLTRIGSEWEVYVAQVDPGTSKHSARFTKRFTDAGSLFSRNLSQVMVHAGAHGTFPTPFVSVYNLTVDRVNSIAIDKPYIIARAGDVIKFDHKRAEITINGEDKKSLKDFGARFFKLPKGQSSLLIDPQDKVTATVKIEEAYQ